MHSKAANSFAKLEGWEGRKKGIKGHLLVSCLFIAENILKSRPV